MVSEVGAARDDGRLLLSPVLEYCSCCAWDIRTWPQVKASSIINGLVGIQLPPEKTSQGQISSGRLSHPE